MSDLTCRLPSCTNPRGQHDGDEEYRCSLFCSPRCDEKYANVQDDRPARSEPADFGGGNSTGVQDL